MTSPGSNTASHSNAEQHEELRGSHLASSSEVDYLHCSLLQYPSAALLAKTELEGKKKQIYIWINLEKLNKLFNVSNFE